MSRADFTPGRDPPHHPFCEMRLRIQNQRDPVTPGGLEKRTKGLLKPNRVVLVAQNPFES